MRPDPTNDEDSGPERRLFRNSRSWGFGRSADRYPLNMNFDYWCPGVRKLVLALALGLVLTHGGRGEVLTEVTEAASEGFTLVYALNLPINAAWAGNQPVPYATDLSQMVPAFDRVGYWLELTSTSGERRWVWASFAADTLQVTRLGLPHDVGNPAARQSLVRDLTVESNVPGLAIRHADDGNIEMWAQGAAFPSSAGIYGADYYFGRQDWGDTPLPVSSAPLYGSFQIHRYGKLQTILAVNGFSTASGAADDVGIGSAPSLPPQVNEDWTLRQNAGAWATRRLSVWVRPQRFSVALNQQPQVDQIIPRDRVMNVGIGRFAGEERGGGWSEVAVRLEREGQPFGAVVWQPLTYTPTVGVPGPGRASFDVSFSIPAERAAYTAALWLRRTGGPSPEERLVRVVTGLAAGDAFVIYGQSNAEAQERLGSAIGEMTPWVRTFGSGGGNPVVGVQARVWVTANPNVYTFYPGGIGQWGGRLARRWSEAEGVPVAVINGAVGGMPIEALVRDDTAGPDDLTKHYQRLRYRTRESGLAGHIRAAFYYQGESDTSASWHTDRFTDLRRTLREDFPRLERIYAVQVKASCGPECYPGNFELREAQRRLGDLFPDVTVVSSNGLLHADLAHLRFIGGYQTLGDQFFDLVRRDLFGQPDAVDISPVNAVSVAWASPLGDRVRITWRRPCGPLTLQPGALADFLLQGSAARILAAEQSPTTLDLTLDRPAPEATALLYVSQHYGPGWVLDSRGRGILSFREALAGTFPVSAITGPVASASLLTDEPTPLRGSGSAPGSTVTRIEWLDSHGSVIAFSLNSNILEAPWIPTEEGLQRLRFRVTNAAGYAAESSVQVVVRQRRGPLALHADAMAWLSAAALDGGVWGTQWADLSGRGLDASAMLPLTVGTESVGVSPGILMGPGQALSAEGWPLTGAASFVLLFQPNAPGSGAWLSHAGYGGWQVEASPDGMLRLRVGGQVRMTFSSSLTNGQPHILSGRLSSEGPPVLELWVDEVAWGSTALDTAVGSTHYTLGGGGPALGAVGEFAVYRRALSELDRQALVTALRAQTGIDTLSYAQWAKALLPAPLRDPAADPDGDGLTQLAEYAFGTAPLQATLRLPWTAAASDTALTLTARTLNTHPSFSLSAQTSDGLTQWASHVPTSAPVGPYQQHQFSAPRLAPRSFVRWQLSLIP
jgi:Carbohydrate esterase, sialic acid-specific acetylesterase